MLEKTEEHVPEWRQREQKERDGREMMAQEPEKLAGDEKEESENMVLGNEQEEEAAFHGEQIERVEDLFTDDW